MLSAQQTMLATEYDEALKDTAYRNKLDNLWEMLGDMPVTTVTRIASSSFSKGAKLRFADLGCGTGRDLLEFEKQFNKSGFDDIELLGCEICNDAVSICHGRNLSVINVDIDSFLNSSDGSFSVLWAHFSLIHLTVAEIGPALSLMVSKLDQKGILAIGFKAGDGSRIRDRGYGVCRETTYFKLDHMEEHFQQNGLEIQSLITVPSGTDRSVPHQYAWIIGVKS